MSADRRCGGLATLVPVAGIFVAAFFFGRGIHARLRGRCNPAWQTPRRRIGRRLTLHSWSRSIPDWDCPSSGRSVIFNFAGISQFVANIFFIVAGEFVAIPLKK